MAQPLLAPPLAKFSRQLPRQLSHHLLAVFTPLPLKQFCADAASDMPVKLGEFGIDCTGHPLAGSVDELANLGQQRGGRTSIYRFHEGLRALWHGLFLPDIPRHGQRQPFTDALRGCIAQQALRLAYVGQTVAHVAGAKVAVHGLGAR